MGSPSLTVSLAFVLMGSASTPTGKGAAESVLVKKVIGDSALVVRSNGAVYLIEKGFGCLSLWRYEGKTARIDSPGLFLGLGSKLIIPDANQSCRIWESKEIPSVRSIPGRPSHVPVEFAFFDSEGRVAVYLDPGDGLTFCLRSGQPVAYLDGDSVYGFNEKHLGWYKDGLVYDHDGDVVVEPASAFRTSIGVALVRGLKTVTMFRSPNEPKPIKPDFGISWSELPARAFFLNGID